MAAERRRLMGELAAWHACAVIARMPFTGENLTPSDVNPFRVEVAKPVALVELEKWQSRRAWRVQHSPKPKGPKRADG